MPDLSRTSSSLAHRIMKQRQYGRDRSIPRRRGRGSPLQKLGQGRTISRSKRRFHLSHLQSGARARLKAFRKSSFLAVALTSLILLIWGNPAVSSDGAAGEHGMSPQKTNDVPQTVDPAASIEEATGTLRELWSAVLGYLPKLVIVLGVCVLAVVLAKVLTFVISRLFSRWEKGVAAATLGRIGLYLLALAIALSVLAGDAKALLGSVGLVGLALSWALQTPIESFTGWLLNSFRSYYRVGDRIEVGDVFGDVYRIDVLTTTVWEAGGPGKAVAGAQATGAMITFPNWEVLRSNIMNYSREFPYVWDEVTVSIANESDLNYAIQVFEGTARRLLAEKMRGPTQEYQSLLQRARIAFDIPEEPKVFLTLSDAWTNCTVRYLVGVRERRRWSTELLLALTKEAGSPQHAGRIIPAYPRTEIKLRESWNPNASISKGAAQ